MHLQHLTKLITGLALALLVGLSVQGQDDPASVIRLNERNTLAALLDLCAERLDLNLEYDEAELSRIAITLRLGQGVTENELWTLTNRLLAAHDWTTIRMPGEDVLSVVRLAEAPKKTDFVQGEVERVPAGFSSLVHEAAGRSPEELVEIIKPLLTQPGGAVTPLGESRFILISDTTARLESISQLLRSIESQAIDETLSVLRVQLMNAAATPLVAQVTAANAAREAILGRPLRGHIAAGLDEASVILVAEESQVGLWQELIEEFDREPAVSTRTYVPQQFDIESVAALIDQMRFERGGSDDRWRVIRNGLTGSLIVTATQAEHEEVETLITRLNRAPESARQAVATIPILNREAEALLDVLEPLVTGTNIETDVTGSGEEDALDNEVEDAEIGESTAAPAATETPGPTTQRKVVGPDIVLSADEATNSLIVIGDRRRIEQVRSLIAELDIRQPQVSLQVLIVSLTDSETRDLGVELQKLEITGSSLIGLSSLFNLSSIKLDSQSPLIGGQGFSGVVLNPGDFSIVIRALETLNDGRSVSMPRVVVNNNEQGVLNSVLQEPFASINASNTVATTSFAATQDAGTQVTVTPQISRGDYLVLEYNITLSSFVGESADVTLPPPRQQNVLQSTVTVPDGYTIAVAGLEIENDGIAVSQVPFLGLIPVLGELFKSRSDSISRSRFYVFIRAEILRHNGFEDLKFMSDPLVKEAGLGDGWPAVEPRIIHSP